MKTLVAAGGLVLALVVPLACIHASAQTGAPPLDPALEGQLERWLGAGDQVFANLYTRRPGDDSVDFRRTAFLFNTTEAAVYRQVPSACELPSQGAFQTFNARDQGPTFGAGPDLLVNDRLDTALSWRLSYGDPAGEGLSIIDGSVGGRFFAIDALELYAVSPIPEPGAAARLAGGLGMVLLARRRRQGRPDAA